MDILGSTFESVCIYMGWKCSNTIHTINSLPPPSAKSLSLNHRSIDYHSSFIKKRKPATMKFSVLALTLFTALTLAAPSSFDARGCSCHKVGDDYSSCSRLPLVLFQLSNIIYADYHLNSLRWNHLPAIGRCLRKRECLD